MRYECKVQTYKIIDLVISKINLHKLTNAIYFRKIFLNPIFCQIDTHEGLDKRRDQSTDCRLQQQKVFS